MLLRHNGMIKISGKGSYLYLRNKNAVFMRLVAFYKRLMKINQKG